jgi:hypothetical protein
MMIIDTKFLNIFKILCEFIGGGAEHEYGPGRNRVILARPFQFTQELRHERGRLFMTVGKFSRTPLTFR